MKKLLFTAVMTVSTIAVFMPLRAQSLKQQNMIASDTQKVGDLAREAN